MDSRLPLGLIPSGVRPVRRSCECCRIEADIIKCPIRHPWIDTLGIGANREMSELPLLSNRDRKKSKNKWIDTAQRSAASGGISDADLLFRCFALLCHTPGEPRAQGKR